MDRFLWVWVMMSAGLIACGGDDDPESPSAEADADEFDAGAIDMEADSAPPDAGPRLDPPVDGDWAVTITLVEFGNIELSFQVSFTTSVDADGLGFDGLELRAVRDGMVSAVLASAARTPIGADGAFAADFGGLVLPGAFSPTQSDVELEMQLAGTVRGPEDICGAVTGRVLTFGTDVTMSTFGAVPVGGDAPGSCDGGGEMLPRLEAAACPELVAGANVDFASGGESRRFVLHVPMGYDADQAWPLVFLHHGLGGTPEGVMGDAGFAALGDELGFFVVAPKDLGLGSGWSSAAAGDSPDLALFDDLLTCLSTQFNIDADRVHSAGHSAGGIYNSYLTLRRSAVLASTAGMSPGLTIEYAAPDDLRPMLIAWGGPDDVAFDQNFDTFAAGLIRDFGGAGHFMVACDHGVLPLAEGDTRHSWPEPAGRWLARFLLDHPRGQEASPYAADGLPVDLPADVCTIVE